MVVQLSALQFYDTKRNVAEDLTFDAEL
ncbi:hypothetical protein RSAG8_07470, partial [Rhizoctonia solani AG-8 WAC10335]